jgi:hypothetical protein
VTAPDRLPSPGRAGRGLKRLLPTSLTGLAGAACVACCVVPILLVAGVLGGAGWAAAARWLPAIAIALTAAAGLAWWWTTRRRHAAGCAGANCSCADQPADRATEKAPAHSAS